VLVQLAGHAHPANARADLLGAAAASVRDSMTFPEPYEGDFDWPHTWPERLGYASRPSGHPHEPLARSLAPMLAPC
jgi:hypothetical protein